MFFEKYPKLDEGGSPTIPLSTSPQWIVTGDLLTTIFTVAESSFLQPLFTESPSLDVCGCSALHKKVHGANFSVLAQDSGNGSISISFAKRSGLIGHWGHIESGEQADIEDFFSVQSQGLLDVLASAAHSMLAALLAQDRAEIDCAGKERGFVPCCSETEESEELTDAVLSCDGSATEIEGVVPEGRMAAAAFESPPAARRSGTVRGIQVYGELYGGKYDHPSVSAIAGLQPVQMGVWYSEKLQFLPFDIAVVFSEKDSIETRHFLDFADATALCKSAGLPFSTPLYSGTLAECLDYPIEFETTIPKIHGLPSLGSENVAEGVVIRPAHEPKTRKCRGLFKRKIAAFSEKKYSNPTFAAARSGGVYQPSPAQLLRWELAAVATPQRVDAVMSKIGRVDPTDRVACQSLLKAMVQDCMDALEPSDVSVVQASVDAEQYLLEQCKAVVTKRILQKAPEKTHASNEILDDTTFGL